MAGPTPRGIVIAAWRRWLRGDVRDVVQVVPRRRPTPSSRVSRVELGAGLDRWAGQLTRQRAFALTRRWLLVAITVALVPAVIVLAVGASRPVWLVAVLAVALVAGAVALLRGVSEVQAARLVDRALGLHDQLGTALELQAGPAPSAGLAAMVLDDATTALRTSLSTARAASRGARVEWAWLVVGACVLAGLIAVPRHGADGGLASGRSGAAGSGLSARVSGTAAHHPGTVTHARAASAVAKPSTTPPPPRGVGATRWAGSTITPGKHAHTQATPQGGTPASHGKSAGSGLSVASAGAVTARPKQGSLGGSGHGGSAGAGQAGSSKPAQLGTGATPSTSGAKGASPGASRTPPTKGTAGGGTAGTGRASVSHRTGVVPTLGTGSEHLPLQAGYTPAGAGHLSTGQGQSQSTSGNGSHGGAAGHDGTSPSTNGTNFTVIPTTSNSPSASDQDLLQSFFGTADQLSFKGW